MQALRLISLRLEKALNGVLEFTQCHNPLHSVSFYLCLRS